jgi:hypothetical protein
MPWAPGACQRRRLLGQSLASYVYLMEREALKAPVVGAAGKPLVCRVEVERVLGTREWRARPHIYTPWRRGRARIGEDAEKLSCACTGCGAAKVLFPGGRAPDLARRDRRLVCRSMAAVREPSWLGKASLIQRTRSSGLPVLERLRRINFLSKRACAVTVE